MNVNLVDSEFSADYFALEENNQPVCTDQFLRGLQVLATQATAVICNHEVVEEAFERIQEAQWGHISSEAKNNVDQKIQEVRKKWVKVCFGKQFRHVAREHLKKNCGPKFHAQYSSVMKDATEPKLNLLPPDGVSVDVYDEVIIKAFLNYFQTGTLSENALNASILDLLSLAHQNQIEGLITKCTELLKEQMDDLENLDTLWEFANQQNIPQLTFACLSYMQANRDKFSTELKEKYEKELPILKALFANEIVLKQSPSGNIEVKIEFFNETASHIEQLSKLFSIKSLIINEKLADRLLKNGKKIYPFLKEISPTLKNLEELIIWNETPKDQDFLTLKNLFPKLVSYGNEAPIFSNSAEVKTYLNNFKIPDENDRESEKLILRSLNLSNLRLLKDVQMAEFTSHLQELYHLNIQSYKLTSVSVLKATEIDCEECIALTTIEAPKATVIDCSSCRALTTIEAPNAIEIFCGGCDSLTTLDAPNATRIICYSCTALTNLEIPKATKIDCQRSKALTTIIAPKATEIHCASCTALINLEAPEATEIFCPGCKALSIIKAPKAIYIDCHNCTALITIEAPEATKIDCRGCTALTNIEAPKATKIDCRGCTKLKTSDDRF